MRPLIKAVSAHWSSLGAAIAENHIVREVVIVGTLQWCPCILWTYATDVRETNGSVT